MSVVLVDGVLWSALPDHGVNSVVVVLAPQVEAEVSTPLSPPLKWRRKWRKVACGFSGTTAVSRPVVAFG